MPYNPNLWHDESVADDWTVEIECMPGRVFILNGEELHAPGFRTPEQKVELALRHVCHFLVDQIDNRGLEEVCRSLAEFYAYYRPTDHMPNLPVARTMRAITSCRSTSPAFMIGEE
jgi:hypothetical protein